MPAEDFYHQTVMTALEKDGWWIVQEQVQIRLANRKMWVDLEISSDDGEKRLVEVKSFRNVRSPVDYLASVIGQYILYQSVLNYLQVTTSLYMAVPITAYGAILSEDIGQVAIRAAKMNLIVYDSVKEKVILWKT
jgi:XisH protein